MLEKIGLNFSITSSNYPEDFVYDKDPAEMVKTLSVRKAEEVARQYPDSIIIAADTIGVLRGKIISKPHTPDEARQMLRSMSGKSHRVFTGFTILDAANKKQVTRSVETRVYLKKINLQEIESYVKSGEPLDKAGAYAIQGLGSVIVKKIVGDYYNVMGLPLSALVESLKEFGINIL